MLQAFRALMEIITTSFGTQSLRCTRAAFWLCVLATFVVGIIAASAAVMTAIFIPTLGGIFMLMTSLYLCLASIWLTVLTARRIRDVGYRTLYFYVYAIITGILGFLSQFGDLNLDEMNELLATLLGVAMLIVHIWILLLCVKPTSPVAEERFGAAIVYSFDMEKLLLDLKKFVALGIVASAIGGVIILIGILGKEAFIDKKVAAIDALELFFFEDSTPSLARNKEGDELLFENGQALAFIEGGYLYKTTFYYKNGIETFLWSETAGASFNPKHNKNIVNEISYESIFADSSRKCKPSILQKYYNHFMTIPPEEIASSQQNHRTIYVPKNRRELLSLVRDDSVNLGDIDTSKITDMTLLFASFCGNELSTTQFIRGDKLPLARVLSQNFTAGERKNFSGIDSWNVDNVWEMGNIFYHSPLQDSPPKWHKGEQ